MVFQCRQVVSVRGVLWIVEVSKVQARAVDRDLCAPAARLFVPVHAFEPRRVVAELAAVPVVLVNGGVAQVQPRAVQTVAVFMVNNWNRRPAPHVPPQEQVQVHLAPVHARDGVACGAGA